STGSPQFTGLSLTNALGVSSGGIGVNTLAANGVLYGNGSGAIQATVAGAPGLCLQSTAGSPTWGVCAGTLQQAYDSGNTILTTANRNINITLANTAVDSDLVVDIAGTGNTIEFRDGGTAFFTASDGGSITLQNTVNSTNALSVRNSIGTEIFAIDTVGGAAVAVGLIASNSINSINVIQAIASGTSSNAILGNATGAGSIGINGTSLLGASGSFQTSNVLGTNTSPTVAVSANTGQTTDLLQFLDTGSNIVSRFNINGRLELGRASALTGSILFQNSTNANTITLQSGVATAVRTLTLPDETGTLCSTGSVCTGYAPASGSSSYVQLAPASVQVDASTNSSVFINKTGASGNILQLQDGGVDSLTLANGGALTLQNIVNNSVGFRVQNSSAVPILTVDTTNQSGNLVTNGTFEGDTPPTQPAGWAPKNAPLSVQSTSAQARTGTKSMAINIDNLGGPNQGAEFPVALSGNTNYNLAFWLRSSSGTLTDIYIGYRSAAVDATVCTSTTNVVSTSWTQLTCSFTTGGGPSATSIFVKKSAASGVTIYSDDVELYNTSGSKLVLGSSTNSVLGQLEFASNAGGSVVFQMSPGATATQNYTIGIPLESGTLCTDNINSPCSITGDLKYLNKNIIDTSTASVGTNGTLYTFTNSNAGDSGRVLALQNGNNRGASLYLANTVDPGIYPDSVLLQVINNSSNRLRIFSGGQIGIDTSSLAPSDDATFGDLAFGGGAGVTRTINPIQSTTGGANGASLQISGGASKTSGTGGALNLRGGAGDTLGTGGSVNIYGGAGGGGSNNGNVFINGYNTIVRPTADNTTAFRVQNAAGSTSYLTVDSLTPAVTLNAATDVLSDSSTAFNVRTAAGSSIFTVNNFADTITLNHDTTINDELRIFSDAANAILAEDTSGEDIFRVDTLSEDINLGSINLTGTISIENGTGASINIGTTNSSRVINIGTTGVAAQTINIGSVNAGSTLTLSGLGGINVANGLNYNSGVDVNFVGGASNFDQSLSSGYFASGTGAVNLNGNVTIGSGLDLVMLGSGAFTSGSGAVTINGSTTIGDTTADRLTVTAQILGASPLVFQGATDNTFESTIAFADPTADHTFTFPDVGVGASDTVCLVTLGNCAGSGSGVTTPGGIAGNIAKFTGGQTIDDSTLSESGTILTASGSLVVQGSSGLTLGVASTTTGNVVFRNSTNANTMTIQSGATSGNFTLTLPTDDGTSNQCLKTDGTGVLSFTACVGGGGGSDAVTDLNTFTGSVSIVGTANQVNVANSLNVITLSTPQSIATTSDVTFDTITANGGIIVSGAISSINENSNFATNINTGTSNGAVSIGNNAAGTFSLQSGSTISIATTGGTPTIGRTGIITTIAGTLNVDETTNLNGNTLLGNASTDRLTITSEILGGTPFVFQGATDNGFSTSFQVSDPTAARTVTIPNNSGVITLNTSGSSADGTSAFVQGGVTWAGLATLGTNDANSLDIETNNITRLTFDTTGNLTVTTLNTGATHTLGIASTTSSNIAGDALSVSSGTGNGTGAGGALTLQAGAGGATGNGGAVSINGGTAAAGNGGGITLQAAAGVGTNKAGGALSFTAGAATGTGNSGDITFTAGNGGSSTGGDIALNSGSATAGGQRGGNLSVTLGNGTGAGNGGGFTLQGGTGGSTGVGGALTLNGGTGGSTSGSGGAISLTGGTANGSGVGGALTLTGGQAKSAFTGGTI
ncbi:MAG: carbohydrate binding domain-containing protein, partial [Patescibacteria group bacterium]